MGRDEISHEGTNSGGIVTETFVWEIRDARGRLLPEARVYLEAFHSTVDPETAVADEAGRVTFSWTYVRTPRDVGDYSELSYCLAYDEPCTPDRTLVTVIPRPS